MAFFNLFLIIIFNRRGRTTTGMVITMLYHRALTLEKVSNDSIYNSFCSDHCSGNKYLQGDYKLIQQLCQLLDQGQIAKQLADECIDACAHMQNLREAIYDHKVRLSSTNLSSDQAHDIESRGLHYLLRYFYLIVFAEYLMEEFSPGKGQLEKSFLSWLAERREITNLTLKTNLSFD